MADNKRTGLSALADAGNDGEDFSVIDAIGGPRGVIESMLPGVVFVVLFVATSNLNLTIAVSAVLAVLQVIVRLIQRQSVMGAVSGLVAVGICLIWAWQTHFRIHYQCRLCRVACRVTDRARARTGFGRRIHSQPAHRAFQGMVP